MAGRFQNNDAQRSMRRLQGEITVDKQDMKDFVNVAKAHASAGNMGDFTTILTALGRLEQQNDVTETIKAQNAEDRKILLAEIDSRMGTQTVKEAPKPVEVVPSWAKELLGRVKSLESK
jgi:hypothetical protein|tara:strand:+ start:162 stop:518 length:357 start_codon:yes stop_codon:yes gene_type:complete